MNADTRLIESAPSLQFQFKGKNETCQVGFLTLSRDRGSPLTVENKDIFRKSPFLLRSFKSSEICGVEGSVHLFRVKPV